MATTTKALTEGDSDFVHYLAEQIDAAADILDQVNSSGIYHRHDQKQHRKVLRDGLTMAIHDNAQRIMDWLACPPAPRTKPTPQKELRVVKEGGASWCPDLER